MYCSRCGTEVANQAKFCPSCGLDLSTSTPLAPTDGERSEVSEIDLVRDALKNEYEIISELGRGGMAIVFHAREKHLDREVAVKTLPFSLAFDKEFVERFQREARTAAKLEHPYIIPIYRVGKSGRVIYFVMKYLRGSSLSEVVQRRGALPPEEIRSFLKQTAGALGYAHQNGIVHRDIKPDNIMFDEIGHAILTDFGIAKAATGTRLTGTGMSIGTPHYMSPEQARAQPLDGRSDIYSLGVVTYQCLTGHVPYDGEDAFAIGYKHIMEELPVPELTTPDQRALFEVVNVMMAKDPTHRFQTANELVARLEGRPTAEIDASAARTVSDLPTTIMPSPARGSAALPAGSLPTTPTTPIPMADPTGKHEPQRAKERKRGSVLVGMFLILILGGGGAGGFWYFFMGATWPPDFSQIGLNRTSAVVADSLPVADSTPVDTALADTAAAVDSVPVPDSVVVPPLPTTGWVAIEGRPSGAEVAINGSPVNQDVVEVSPGAQRVVAQRSGYRPFDVTIQVARGDTVPVTIAMERIPQPQCSNPEAARYNMNNFCFDTAASANQACVIPLQGADKPQPAQLWVSLEDDGSVATFRFTQRPTNPRFGAAIQRYLRSGTFTPASKGGQPVASWLRLTCRAR